MCWLWWEMRPQQGVGTKRETLAKDKRMSDFGNPQIPPSHLWYPGSECRDHPHPQQTGSEASPKSRDALVSCSLIPHTQQVRDSLGPKPAQVRHCTQGPPSRRNPPADTPGVLSSLLEESSPPRHSSNPLGESSEVGQDAMAAGTNTRTAGSRSCERLPAARRDWDPSWEQAGGQQ